MTTIQFNNKKALFTQLSPSDINFIKTSSKSYITTNNIINQLSSIDLPIKKETAIKRILHFLEFVDQKIKDVGTEIPIDKSVWIDFFTENHYIKYQAILSDLKIITRVLYTKGVYFDKSGKKHVMVNDFVYSKDLGLAKIFQVHNAYINDNNYIMVMFDTKQVKVNLYVDNRLKKLSPKFINTIKNVKIDVTGAIQAEINEYQKQIISFPQLKHRISRIFAVRNSRKIVTGSKVNRIYHSFTNLSKISRQFLNYKFFEIDVTNCQPTLLVAYLSKNKLELDENYQLDCESGCFYERFIDLINDNYTFGDDIKDFNQARTATKTEIYRNLFFGFNTGTSINKRFKELYPNVWNELAKIKKSDTSLASILQNTEAELFNSLFPKKSKMFFTLFDAVYFTNVDDTADLESKINDFFLERNVKVKIEKK